jgi:glutathione S-transferase
MKAYSEIRDDFVMIEDKLKTNGGLYAVGSTFTVVDPYLLVFYRWGVAIGVNMKVGYPYYIALVVETC